MMMPTLWARPAGKFVVLNHGHQRTEISARHPALEMTNEKPGAIHAVTGFGDVDSGDVRRFDTALDIAGAVEPWIGKVRDVVRNQVVSSHHGRLFTRFAGWSGEISTRNMLG